MFDWEIDADNPMTYGTVAPYTRSDGIGIGGGVGPGPEGYGGHVTIYGEVSDVEVALTEAERLRGKRLMGPDKAMEGAEIGQFADPEGHLIGLLKALD